MSHAPLTYLARQEENSVSLFTAGDCTQLSGLGYFEGERALQSS